MYAKDVWNKLEARYSQTDNVRIYELQLTLSQFVQGSQTVMEYFTKLSSIWEELHMHRPPPSCGCGKCNCQALVNASQINDTDQVFQFLMGLQESYDGIRGQIIMMIHVPTLERAYSIILTEERQKNSRHTVANANGPSTYHMRQGPQSYLAKRKGKELTCSHCGYTNHTVDKCFRLIGFPNDFKFTKKPTYAKNHSSVPQFQSTKTHFVNKLLALP